MGKIRKVDVKSLGVITGNPVNPVCKVVHSKILKSGLGTAIN